MGWRDVAKRLEELGKLRASVGWHDSAKYPDGTPVATAAVTQEFGSTKMNVPPRPMMRSTIGDQQKEWARQAGLGFKAVAKGSRTPEQVITALGELAAGDVRMKISQITEPPLAEETQRRRKKLGYKPDKPLVRSGHMLATCTSEIIKK
ncbi:structural protein [Yersinia phage vB_YenM_P744]